MRPILLFLTSLAAAELLTLVGLPWLGLGAHGVLLFGLTIYSATARAPVDSRLFAGLMLVPVIRLVSFALPLARLPELYWPAAVAVPVLAATTTAMLGLRLRPSDVGVTARRLWLQVPFAGVGFGVGALIYVVLGPNAAREPDPGLTGAWLAALSVAVFSVELVFRGLLVTLARPASTAYAVMLSGSAYTILHLGHGSPALLLVAFAMSVTYGIVAVQSRSIVGAVLAQGATQVSASLVIPGSGISGSAWLVVGATTLGIVAMAAMLLPSERASSALAAVP